MNDKSTNSEGLSQFRPQQLCLVYVDAKKDYDNDNIYDEDDDDDDDGTTTMIKMMAAMIIKYKYVSLVVKRY